MTIGYGIATLFGSFLFPFMIRMLWDNMVREWGALGGWMASAFIIGTVWTLNHGLETPMITQSGQIWIDMALAGGIGVLVASFIKGGKVKKNSLVNGLLAAVVGAVLSGLLLSFFL